jgi:O-antigen/teichoic acid export membrane protein
MVIVFAAAMLNLGLNWLLVPPFGGLGAAVATAVSFLAWIVAALCVSERLWRVGFPLALMGGQIVLGAAAVAWLVARGSDSWVSVLGTHLVVGALVVSTIDRRGLSALKRMGAAHV